MLPSNENRQHNLLARLRVLYICKCIPAQEQERKKNREHQSISCLLAPFLPLSYTHTFSNPPKCAHAYPSSISHPK